MLIDPEERLERLSGAVTKAAQATSAATRAWTHMAELAVSDREPSPEQRIDATLAVKEAQMHLAQASEALGAMARSVSAAIDEVMQAWREMPPVGNA